MGNTGIQSFIYIVLPTTQGITEQTVVSPMAILDVDHFSGVDATLVSFPMDIKMQTLPC